MDSTEPMKDESTPAVPDNTVRFTLTFTDMSTDNFRGALKVKNNILLFRKIFQHNIPIFNSILKGTILRRCDEGFGH